MYRDINTGELLDGKWVKARAERDGVSVWAIYRKLRKTYPDQVSEKHRQTRQKVIAKQKMKAWDRPCAKCGAPAGWRAMIGNGKEMTDEDLNKFAKRFGFKTRIPSGDAGLDW